MYSDACLEKVDENILTSTVKKGNWKKICLLKIIFANQYETDQIYNLFFWDHLNLPAN